jgi:hypothetical protein
VLIPTPGCWPSLLWHSSALNIKFQIPFGSQGWMQFCVCECVHLGPVITLRVDIPCLCAINTITLVPPNTIHVSFVNLFKDGLGGFKPPPRNSEVLTKLSQIPSSIENTSVTT